MRRVCWVESAAIQYPMLWMVLGLLVFLSPVLAAINSQDAQLYTMPEPTVRVDAGPIIGTTTSLPAATASVVKFLGIPFADKARRFQPPEKPRLWKRPLRTQRWRPACIQQFNAGPHRDFMMAMFNGGPSIVYNGNATAVENTTVVESEDCLYLNVYAPATPSVGRGRAVMFWLFGGKLQFENAGQMQYDGSSFASYQDVIVVTSNYRTNVFGFPASTDLPLRQRNLGFLDQRLALDWVQRNIDVFGGDPEKVVIAGESAGAISVDALLTSYGQSERPPFSGAILQSGQVSYSSAPREQQTSIESWKKLVAELKCSGNDTLSCLSDPKIKVSHIKEILENNALTFSPVFDNRTLMSNPAKRRASGLTTQVPVMIGTDSQEGRIIVRGQDNLQQYLTQRFQNESVMIRTLAEAYTPGRKGLATQYDSIAQIVTELTFQCPAALWANTSAAVGIPTWRYYFNASFPNLETFPNAGVYHASEIRLVFGTHNDGKNASTPTEEALSEFMQGAWARFAKDPWAGPGWTGVGLSPQGFDLGNIGSMGSSGMTMIKPREVDSRCNLYTPIYKKVADETSRKR